MGKILGITPVLPSQDIRRDTDWYEKKVGFHRSFGESMYAGLYRDGLWIHLQWHADTAEDPLLGGSVVKFFVDEIDPYIREFIGRGIISEDRVRRDTPWGTHEFGFYDLNGNAIFFVQDAPLAVPSSS